LTKENDVTALSIGDNVTGDFLRVALDADSGKLNHCIVLAEAARAALSLDLARLNLLAEPGKAPPADRTAQHSVDSCSLHRL
jgi:hypothetical protein